MERPGLNSHEFRVGIVATHLVVVADDFARRSLEIGELGIVAAGIGEVHQPGSFDAISVLIDDRANVVERSRSLGGTLQLRSNLRCRQRSSEEHHQKRGGQGDAAKRPVESVRFKAKGAHPARRRRQRAGTGAHLVSP